MVRAEQWPGWKLGVAMATTYRHTGVWVLPAFVLAGVVSWPFSFLMGPWAYLVGLPVVAVVLLVFDRADFVTSDLGSLAAVLLLVEFGVFVALLVTLARDQAEDVGWWLPVLEAIVVVAVLAKGPRALRTRRCVGKELVWEHLTLGETWKVTTLGKVAVEHAGKLLDGNDADFDRRSAVEDLRRRMRRRPELVQMVLTAISQRTSHDDPRARALAAELVNEATAAHSAS
jgi:hypothetical protein